MATGTEVVDDRSRRPLRPDEVAGTLPVGRGSPRQECFNFPIAYSIPFHRRGDSHTNNSNTRQMSAQLERGTSGTEI